MKTKLIITAVLSFFTAHLAAQNTFPSSGNVGIGTTSPLASLEIRGSTDIYNGYLRLTHNTPYGDANDGKIGNSLFAQGLNIVGINNDNTIRKIQIWGSITQNENGGTNSFTGNNLFAGNTDIASGFAFKLVHNTPYGDINDGKIGNSLFAQGLNIVGINNDNTGRKIQVWGGITQNENGGGNFFNGNTNFSQSVSIGAVAQPAGYNLYVANGILTEKVKVAVKTSADWADYVFDEKYRLMPLHQVAQFIQQHQHLPGMLSASDMVKEGNDLGQTDAQLLAKIEELTLHVIELSKQNERQQSEINALKNQLKAPAAKE
jgi:hypothetical protein